MVLLLAQLPGMVSSKKVMLRLLEALQLSVKVGSCFKGMFPQLTVTLGGVLVITGACVSTI